MAKEKYIKIAENLFKKSPVVSISSVERITKNKNYAKQLVRNLVIKGKIKRLVKGYYTIHDDPSLAVLCFRRAYLGLQDALSFHNLWEQETIPVIITTDRARQGLRKIIGTNVFIRRIDRKYSFGFGYCNYHGNLYLPYSDIEKTLIDLVYFRQKLSEDLKKGIIRKIDRKKLGMYLKAYPKRFRKRIINLLTK